MSRIHFTGLFQFEFLKKPHLPVRQVKHRIHQPKSKIRVIEHYLNSLHAAWQYCEKQPAQQAFPIEVLRESQSGSKRKIPSPSSVIFFALVPAFQTNLTRKRLLRRLVKSWLFSQTTEKYTSEVSVTDFHFIQPDLFKQILVVSSESKFIQSHH